VAKLADDECYPTEILQEFKSFTISSMDDYLPAYNLIKNILVSFNGDAEKFYPSIYKAFIKENPYKNLSTKSSRLLSFEVANHVLAHLTGVTFKDDIITFKCDEKKFNEKERSIIAYLGGYVFGTFYRRIRFSKSSNSSLYHQQCLSFLVAGKCTGETPKLPEHQLVNTHDRGGLWKVNKDVVDIFCIAESFFLSTTKNNSSKIDSKAIVSALMKDTWVLLSFSQIRRSSPDTIKKEVVLNLIEDLLTLYFRVRTFSYVKDKQQLYKIQKSKTRTNSLRTTIKKQSSNLQQGH